MNKNNLAIKYLADAVDMGYYEATFELAIAYQNLAKWYSSQGGKTVQIKLKSEMNE